MNPELNNPVANPSKRMYQPNRTAMKRHALKIAAVLLPLFGGVSCMTTYDAYGRPVQSVDPGAAAVGVAAAGLVGYAIAKNQDDHRHHHHHHYPRRHRHYRY